MSEASCTRKKNEIRFIPSLFFSCMLPTEVGLVSRKSLKIRTFAKNFNVESRMIIYFFCSNHFMNTGNIFILFDEELQIEPTNEQLT